MNQVVPRAIKRNVRRLLLAARRINARARALPDFIIIGAQRSGTTFLYSCLTQHGALHASANKEVHYFDSNYNKGELWYRAQFPLKRELTNGCLTGEASPSYLFLPEVPPRIHALLPDVKLIVLLRDPVERAVSHYNYERKMGRELLSLEEALDFETRQEAGESINPSDYKHGCQDKKTYRSYLRRGRYYEQLLRYSSLFDENSMLVMRSEDLFQNAADVLHEVFSFLGVEPLCAQPGMRRRNASGIEEQMPGAVRCRLTDYYRKPNELLYGHLKRNFGWQ